MMDCLECIPEKIKIYLREIADRIKQGRAAVMVGSGFSKNAVKCRNTSKEFLDWSQLGDIFYKKLYGKKPQEEECPNYYQDILKLASKVEQCLGRTTLDRLLLDNLPDEEYEPSELHELLLKLNWTDIFTTNYDTLLERTRVKVFDRRYQVVLNKDDLVYSKCPRIIKLHGSFPSTRPFILTEEDYRRYPKESAVFVNTVQQALIENVMCMVGFSGDDPNFLNWIGWIRDNLGSSAASKIYMVGVFDVKETELKLYGSRNIVLINMKDCSGIEVGQHKEGLKLFFQALRELQDAGGITESYLDEEDEICACMDAIISNIHENTGSVGEKEKMEGSEKEKKEIEKKEIEKIMNFWKNGREYYPGWIIMPYRKREELERSIYRGNSLLQALQGSKIRIPDMGDFLYEFDWRRERCLLSLEPETAEWYRYYLDEKWKDIEGDGKHLHNLSKKDMQLYLSLLSFFREWGNFNEWTEWERRLSWYWLDEEQEICRYCERAYRLFYDFEYSELSEKLVEWPDEIKNGETILLHAALLCELGYFEKAVWLLKLNLDVVRGQIGENADYQNYSKEAYIIALLESIEKYSRFVAFRDETKRETESYAHLRALWSYDCNPEYERDYLISKMIYKQRDCDSETEDGAYMRGNSAQVIRFMEQTGSIFRNSYLFRHDKEYTLAVMGIAKVNPYLALVCTLRFDDIIACQQIWGRETSAFLKEKQADQIIESCILACRKNKGYILETLGKDTTDGKRCEVGTRVGSKSKIKVKSIVITLPRLCPAIIAGVVHKASAKMKKQAVEFISFTLENPELMFGSLDLMVNAVAASLTGEELGLYMEEFLKMPLGQEVEPFHSLDLRKAQKCGTVNIRSKSIPKSTGNEAEKESVYIRKLAYSIITGRFQEGEAAAKAIEKKVAKQEKMMPRAVVKIYYYYHIMFGQEKTGWKGEAGKQENMKKVKSSWLEYFREQVRQFAEMGRNYCPFFRKEAKKLLSELKFYHYNISGNHISWTAGEIKEVIGLLVKWAKHVNECCGCRCRTGFEYIEGWYILWEILLEVLFHEDKGEEFRAGIQLKELGDVLRQIDIPFTAAAIFTESIPVFTEEIYDILVPKLFDDKKYFIEIGKMVGIYIITGKGERTLLERLWKLILHIGERHAVEMSYLRPLADEVLEWM